MKREATFCDLRQSSMNCGSLATDTCPVCRRDVCDVHLAVLATLSITFAQIERAPAAPLPPVLPGGFPGLPKGSPRSRPMLKGGGRSFRLCIDCAPAETQDMGEALRAIVDQTISATINAVSVCNAAARLTGER